MSKYTDPLFIYNRFSSHVQNSGLPTALTYPTTIFAFSAIARENRGFTIVALGREIK